MADRVRKLGSLDKLAFASGDVSINLSIQAASFLIFAFHVQVLGLTPIDSGWILLLARLVDAFSDPLMGLLTGKVNTKWGKYRPWLVVASVPLGLSMFLMFQTIEGDYQLKLIWAAGTYIFNTLMFTAVTIPYISLIGVITNDPNDRIAANTYRFVLAKTSSLLVTSFVPYLVVAENNTAASYSTAFLILGIITIIFLVFCGLKTPEQIRIEGDDPPFFEQLKSLFKNKQWIIIIVTIVLIMIGLLTRGTVALIYATTFLHAQEGFEAALFMSMWSAGGVLAAIVSKKLTDKYNKVGFFEYSMYGSVILGIASYLFVPEGHFTLGVVFYFLFCFVSDLHTPILWASVAEVADYGRIKTGVNATGLTMGTISFSQKLGMGISGPLVGYILSYFEYDAGAAELSSATLDGISMTMCLVPAVFFLLAGLVMRKYVIDNKYYVEMLNSYKLTLSKQNTTKSNREI